METILSAFPIILFISIYDFFKFFDHFDIELLQNGLSELRIIFVDVFDFRFQILDFVC